MKIITLDQIKAVLPKLDLLPEIEAGFASYSAGQAVVPPVGELILEGGEVHIKYGYIQGDDYYVIKIASGFFGNPQMGLPTGNGLMLLFDQHTGKPVSILIDEGYLTDVRTAIAGAIAAKFLAPKNINRIGIVGTGVQARLQLEYLLPVTDCRDVLVWGRGETQITRYIHDMKSLGFSIEQTLSSRDILHTCNLIVTTTPAKEPILHAGDLSPGVHITAVGSDAPYKQEIDAKILKHAHLIVADSISQCLQRGEIHQAIKSNHISKENILELGNIISGRSEGRTSDDQVSIADLTGVAVQDIKIAMAVFDAMN